MDKKPRRSRNHLKLVKDFYIGCFPEFNFELLTIEEITALPADSRERFSLKVYASAYFIAMKEYTGDPDSIDSQVLLELCQDEVSHGHEMEIR